MFPARYILLYICIILVVYEFTVEIDIQVASLFTDNECFVAFIPRFGQDMSCSATFLFVENLILYNL